MSKAKNGKATDGKSAAAGDKPTGNGPYPFKTPKQKPSPQYKVADKKAVKRGFLLEFVNFAEKKGTVTIDQLIPEFNNRQIDGRKVTIARIRRYVSYCVAHGIFKKVSA